MLCGVRGRRGVLSYAQPDRQGKAPGGQPRRRRCGVHVQGRGKGGVGARRQGRPRIRRRGGRGGAPAPQKVRPARRARQDGDPLQGRHCRVSPDVPRGRGGRGQRNAAWRRRAPSTAACRRTSLPSSLPSGIGGRGLTARAVSGRTAGARCGRINRPEPAGVPLHLPLPLPRRLCIRHPPPRAPWAARRARKVPGMQAAGRRGCQSAAGRLRAGGGGAGGGVSEGREEAV